MENDLDSNLFEKIKGLITESKNRTYQYINSEMSWLYFNIGRLINEQILTNSKEDYGTKKLEALSKRLTQEFGRGWSVKQLRSFSYFYRTFKDYDHLEEMISSLSWSVIREIMYIKEPLKREFFILMAQNNRWSVRELQKQKNGLLYERTLLSQKPEAIIKRELNQFRKSQTLSPDIAFKDPYILDFLNLKPDYLERDLETALINDIEETIKEFGTDFSFVARQYRIQIDEDDYYIDLLFYHRKLKCLVAIDLKTRPFKAQDKGQMEFYLNWLEKYERQEGENPPIGLILCTDVKKDYFELLELNEGNLRAASYLLKIPDMKVLEEKLKERIKASRELHAIKNKEDV